MKKNGTTIAVGLGLAMAAALPLAAHAQTTTRGVYVGVGAGQSEALEYECAPLPECKPKGTAYRFFTGWQFGRHWAAEVAFTDLGHASSSVPATFDDSVKVRATDLTLVGIWPATEKIALYGRAGGYYARATHDTTLNGASRRVNQSNGNLTFAGGLQWYFVDGLALRFEGQRYMKVGVDDSADSDYNVYSVGLLWKFR